MSAPRFYLSEICPDGTQVLRDGLTHCVVGAFYVYNAPELLALLNRPPHLFDGIAGQVVSSSQGLDSVEREIAAGELHRLNLDALAAEIDADRNAETREHGEEKQEIRLLIEEAVGKLAFRAYEGSPCIVYQADVLAALAEIFGERSVPALLSDVCRCGHRRDQHIHDVGFCRPGFVCSCEGFRRAGDVEVSPAVEGDVF